MPPRDSVRDLAAAVRGFSAAHADLVSLSEDALFVERRAEVPWGTVGVVSGGGSGHEPLHLGFVGEGMLSVAVPGPVFTSPSAYSILAGIRAANRGAGVICIVKHYTGDVLNFDIAAELAALEGIETRTVVVADDVAVRGIGDGSGRRGIAGVVLLEKIIGASADRGDDLDTVAEIGARALERLGSIGFALAATTSPITHRPSFDLGPHEMEFGVGLHGEPGIARVASEPIERTCARLWKAIVAGLSLEAGSDIIVLVNGLGGMPNMDLYAALTWVQALAEHAGVRIRRELVGSFATALDMEGLSLSVLRVDDEMLSLWDAPVVTPALRWGR